MIDPAYHSPLMCLSGHHNWTTWSNFVPVYPSLKAGMWREEAPTPEYTPVEAYRWRHCQCGAAEREAYGTHERKLFGPEDSPAPTGSMTR